jgi:hypothetical protein
MPGDRWKARNGLYLLLRWGIQQPLHTMMKEALPQHLVVDGTRPEKRTSEHCLVRPYRKLSYKSLGSSSKAVMVAFFMCVLSHKKAGTQMAELEDCSRKDNSMSNTSPS